MFHIKRKPLWSFTIVFSAARDDNMAPGKAKSVQADKRHYLSSRASQAGFVGVFPDNGSLFRSRAANWFGPILI